MDQPAEIANYGPLRDGGRVRLRNRRIFLSILAGLPLRMLQISSAIILLPLAYRYLGVERFGLWAAVTSLAPIAALADCGIGAGLVTIVAVANGADDQAALRRGLAAALAAVSGIAAILLLAIAIFYAAIDWAGWLNVAGTEAAADASPSLTIFLGCSALLLPLTLAARVRSGLQEAFVNSAWDAAGVVVGLGSFVLATQFGASMPHLILAIAVPPLLAGAANWLSMIWRRPWLRPSIRAAGRDDLVPILRLGLFYLALAGTAALATGTDSLVAIHMLGPEAAAGVGIASKVFSAGQALVLVALSPLWPAFGEALVRRDVIWVRRTLALALAASGGGGLALALALTVVTNYAVHYWLGPDVTVPTGLLISNAIWLTLIGFGNALGMLLNGAGVVRAQVTISLIYAATAFMLKLILTPWLGAAGIGWASAIGYAGIFLPLYAVLTIRYMNNNGFLTRRIAESLA